MPMSVVAALFASGCEHDDVPPISMLRALPYHCVNTSLSGTLFF
jgi:hypothetical protein